MFADSHNNIILTTFIKLTLFIIVPGFSFVNNLTGEGAVSLISCMHLTENKSQ